MRERERETERKGERQTDRQRDTHRDRKRETERDRERETERDREREKDAYPLLIHRNSEHLHLFTAYFINILLSRVGSTKLILLQMLLYRY